MKSGITTLLILAIFSGGGYWYYQAIASCGIPIAYRVGDIDPRFNIGYEEVRTHVSNAESMWEDATGKNLFTYDEGADLTISFIFDDRQAASNAESNLRDVLEQREWESQAVRSQYENLVDTYETLVASYEKQTTTYESRLRSHNMEVEEWNVAGGAPEDVYTALGERQQALAAEQEQLNDTAAELNSLVKQMNDIGSKGNSLIDEYNNVVERYNENFTEGGEFTQGDYQGDRIHIYEYTSTDELEIVLAHEFGHALSLGHVEGEDSVMYHLMEAQSLDEGVTQNDVDAFQNACGTERFTLWPLL